MRVVLYARVSSERQVEKDLSIAGQLKALRKYALDRDWEVYKEFVDEAESARSANRPAFQEMISRARQRQKPFDSILVWKLSRFARNREISSSTSRSCGNRVSPLFLSTSRWTKRQPESSLRG